MNISVSLVHKKFMSNVCGNFVGFYYKGIYILYMSRSAEKLELYKMLIQLLSLEEITIMLTGLLKFLSFGRCINNNQKIHTQACLCPFFFFK